MFSYGQRSKCADLLNSYDFTSNSLSILAAVVSAKSVVLQSTQVSIDTYIIMFIILKVNERLTGKFDSTIYAIKSEMGKDIYGTCPKAAAGYIETKKDHILTRMPVYDPLSP